MQFESLVSSLPRKRERELFKHARTAALTSVGIGRGSYRVGAVLADGRHIQAAACNSYKSHPMLVGMEYPHLHAEMAAMFDLGIRNCEGLDLYVLRIWRDGQTVAMAKPCDRCQGFIRMAGINKVHYTTYESVESYVCV